MSFKQGRYMLLCKIQKYFKLIAHIFVVLMSKSVRVGAYLLKIIINQFGKSIILVIVGFILSILIYSFLQAIAQVITNYQYSFVDSNITPKEATPIATNVITIIISTCALIGVALLNINQNRDYSIKKKDAIYAVYDKIWYLLTNTRYFSKPYMSAKDALTLYDDFTCKIMGAGTYKLKKKWLSIEKVEKVFEKFFSSQETLDDSEKKRFYDCIELMEKQISGFTSSSLKKHIIDKFLK